MGDTAMQRPGALLKPVGHFGIMSRLVRLRDAEQAVKRIRHDNERLRKAIFNDGKLKPTHFEWWAEETAEELGYSGSELENLLRRLATLKEQEQDNE